LMGVVLLVGCRCCVRQVRAQRDRAWSEHKEGSSGGSSWLASLLGTMRLTQAPPREDAAMEDGVEVGSAGGAETPMMEANDYDVGDGVNLTGTLIAIDRCVPHSSRSHNARRGCSFRGGGGAVRAGRKAPLARRTASKTDETILSWLSPHHASSAPWSSPPSLAALLSAWATRESVRLARRRQPSVCGPQRCQ
jgi:hypothetical protein